MKSLSDTHETYNVLIELVPKIDFTKAFAASHLVTTSYLSYGLQFKYSRSQLHNTDRKFPFLFDADVTVATCSFKNILHACFCADFLSAKNNKLKMYVQKSSKKHFLTRKLVVKCWWNWYLMSTLKLSNCEVYLYYFWVNMVTFQLDSWQREIPAGQGVPWMHLKGYTVRT